MAKKSILQLDKEADQNGNSTFEVWLIELCTKGKDKDIEKLLGTASKSAIKEVVLQLTDTLGDVTEFYDAPTVRKISSMTYGIIQNWL